MNITRARAEDYDELMSLMVDCFRTVRADHPRFEVMYPDLYQPNEESMARHRIVREGGRIVASVGIYPLELRLGSVTLRVGGVGGVCTHPSERGKGHMAVLMKRIVDDLKKEGYALSWLTGDRLRYRRFGWETCGSTMVLEFRGLREGERQAVDVKRLKGAMDPAVLGAIVRARSSLKVCGLCDQSTLERKLRRVDVALRYLGEGDAFAYLAVNERSGQVVEWGGSSDGVRNLFEDFCAGASVRTLALPDVYDTCTGMFAGRARGARYACNNVAVLDLRGVLDSYGSYLARIWPEGRRLRLERTRNSDFLDGVLLEEGRVSEGDGSSAEELRLDEHLCTRLLLGPFAPSLLVGEEYRWLDAIFPLPFHVPYLWHV